MPRATTVLGCVKSSQATTIWLTLCGNNNSGYTKQRFYAQSRLQGVFPWRFVNSYLLFYGLSCSRPECQAVVKGLTFAPNLKTLLFFKMWATTYQSSPNTHLRWLESSTTLLWESQISQEISWILALLWHRQRELSHLVHFFHAKLLTVLIFRSFGT
jgi:hypothetical protein